MDLMLLVVQLVLVLILVVMPVMSGYDKFVAWTPARRAIAVGIAAALSAVIFTQYRKLRMIHTESLAESFTNAATPTHVAWYARTLQVTPVEYLLSTAVLGLMASQAILSLRKGRYREATPWLATCLVIPALALAIKLHLWR